MARLREQAEAMLCERAMQSIDPLHLAVAQRHFVAVRTIDLDTVAAVVFCHVARRIGGGQHGGQRQRGIGYVHDADADADVERAILPDEAELGHGRAQHLRNL